MANALIAYANRADDGTLSGGSWIATLPLTNLQQRTYGRVARSTNAALTSTKFALDLGAGKLSRTVALANHNFSLEAKVRVRCGNDATMATLVEYDSGWVSAWPAVYDTIDLPWEHESFWPGTYSEEERSGYRWTHIVSSPTTIGFRYMLVEIDDVNNLAGFVQIGRLFVGPAWQTKVNMSIGNGIGWESSSTSEEALSGGEYFDERQVYRVTRFTTGWMMEGEAMGSAFDIQRRSNTTREVVFQYDPADTLQALRRSYMGRLRQLTPIEHPTITTYSTGWEIKELL